MARWKLPNAAEPLLRSVERQQMMELIRQGRGIPTNLLRQQLGIGWGSFYNHLVRLKAAGLVQTVNVGRRRVLLPAYSDLSTEARGRAILRAPSATVVARTLVDRPGVS